VSLRSYLRDLKEDKYLLGLILVKWGVAAVFVAQLVTLRENLNEMQCRYAVETVSKAASTAAEGVLK
jgi:hypothetical protein